MPARELVEWFEYFGIVKEHQELEDLTAKAKAAVEKRKAQRRGK